MDVHFSNTMRHGKVNVRVHVCAEYQGEASVRVGDDEQRELLDEGQAADRGSRAVLDDGLHGQKLGMTRGVCVGNKRGGGGRELSLSREGCPAKGFTSVTERL